MSDQHEPGALQRQLRSENPRPQSDTHELVVRIDEILELGAPDSTVHLNIQMPVTDSVDDVFPVTTQSIPIPDAVLTVDTGESPIVPVEVTHRPRSGKRRGPAVPAYQHLAGAGYVAAYSAERMTRNEKRIAVLVLGFGAAVATWAAGALSTLGWSW